MLVDLVSKPENNGKQGEIICAELRFGPGDP